MLKRHTHDKIVLVVEGAGELTARRSTAGIDRFARVQSEVAYPRLAADDDLSPHTLGYVIRLGAVYVLAYLDGDLDPAWSAPIDAHLALPPGAGHSRGHFGEAKVSASPVDVAYVRHSHPRPVCVAWRGRRTPRRGWC